VFGPQSGLPAIVTGRQMCGPQTGVIEQRRPGAQVAAFLTIGASSWRRNLHRKITFQLTFSMRCILYYSEHAIRPPAA
jgi:hypothetical protein